ncbi:hypothetical protein OAX78_00180, partial [Planctomycetota bacterium]|nr:hypothetical protein [Planctomycetota bacterium]
DVTSGAVLWQVHVRQRPGAEGYDATPMSCALYGEGEGHYLFVGHDDSTVQYWHLVPGQPARGAGRPNAHYGAAVRLIKVLPPGTWGRSEGPALLTAGTDGRLIVRDLGTGSTQVLIDGEGGPIFAVDVSTARGQLTLAAGCTDGTVWLFDHLGRVTRKIRGHPEAAVSSCNFTPDGEQLATVSRGPVRMWSLDSVKRVPGAGALAFTHRRRRVACFVREQLHAGRIVFYDLNTGKLAADMPSIRLSGPALGHVLEVPAIQISRDDRFLVVATQQEFAALTSQVLVFDLTRGVLLHQLDRDFLVQTLYLDPDGQRLFVGEDTHAFLESGRPTIQYHAMPDVREHLGSLDWHRGSVTSLQLRDDQHLVSGGDDGYVAFWDLADSSAPLASLEPMASDSAAGQGVRAEQERTSKSLSLESRFRGGVAGAGLSPDGTLLATACGDSAVRLWDVSQPRPELAATLEGHMHRPVGCAFTPSGDLLVSASQDGTVKVWDVGMRRALRPIVAAGGLESIRLSPDGSTLVGAAEDETLWIWEIEAPSIPGFGSGAVEAMRAALRERLDR